MGNVVDIREAKGKTITNVLVDWRQGLCSELEEKGYTTSIPQDSLFSDPVDTSADLYELNSKVLSMCSGEKLVLFRNFHFEILFYMTYDQKLLLKVNSMASGLDAVLLANKFSEEQLIINKYHNLLLEIFS